MAIDTHDIQLGPARVDVDQIILIVVGAHLRAEVGDRPLAYALQQRMAKWIREDDPQSAIAPVVCSDIWYLNNDDLRARPTVSIGGPGVNALSAFLGDKLPSVFTIDGVLTVQMDPEFGDLIASCWGVDHAATVSAVEAFCERYLDEFMRRAVVPA